MRAVALILVLVGGLALGLQGVGGVPDLAPAAGAGSRDAGWVPPVLGGIAVVTGLILLASTGRRE